jgi:hypothetical protein
MKAYGIPRNLDAAYPDCADVRRYANKSGDYRLPGHGGDIHSAFRDSAAKRRTRRIWKKVARRAGRVVCELG